MPEPEEVRFACIGCGAMNPAGAEVCSGCGHRFASPGGGPIPRAEPDPVVMIPEGHFRDDDLYKPGQPVAGTSHLGCLARAAGVTLAVISTVVAFCVAFFATCVATNTEGGNPLAWSSLAGLAAAGAVVAFSAWVASFSRKS